MYVQYSSIVVFHARFPVKHIGIETFDSTVIVDRILNSNIPVGH